MGAMERVRRADDGWRVCPREGVWDVVRADGSVHGTYPSEMGAKVALGMLRGEGQRRQGPRALRGQERACLCCGAVFRSEGIHHRMCTPCRGRGEDVTSYGLAPRSGRPR